MVSGICAKHSGYGRGVRVSRRHCREQRNKHRLDQRISRIRHLRIFRSFRRFFLASLKESREEKENRRSHSAAGLEPAKHIGGCVNAIADFHLPKNQFIIY